MRLLVLCRYSRLGASSRLRFMQYFPAFERAGIEVTCIPFFGDDYVTGLYAGSVSRQAVAASYLKRLKALIFAGRYDAVWAEAELLPYLPAAAERALTFFGVPLVLDYDDAIFHRYDLNSRPLVRRLLGRKIDSAMRYATAVTAGNDYLAQHAIKAGCPRVERLPTVVDLKRYPVVQASEKISNAQVTIGWIGSPATAHYLQLISAPLRQLKMQYSLRCIAVGARADQVVGTPFEAIEWAESSEVETLASIDIGVMPLTDSPWERGKCGYKLIQYMASGKPVVASPVGVNSEIVAEGRNGYLADNETQWFARLEELIADEPKRVSFGLSGRKIVENAYSVQSQVAALVAIFGSLGK